MLHPHTELRFVNRELGFGVFATQLIPRGTLTWVRDDLDQVISPDRLATLPPRFRALLDKYTFRDATGCHILCWDAGRFMNHSCAPTCLGPGSDFEVAVRDILAGEELTDDYGGLYLQPHENFDCCCGEANCRRRITGTDAARHASDWEALLEPALRLMHQVPQPLWQALQDWLRSHPLTQVLKLPA